MIRVRLLSFPYKLLDFLDFSMAGANIVRSLVGRGHCQAAASAAHRGRAQRAGSCRSYIFVVTWRLSHGEILARGVWSGQCEPGTEAWCQVAHQVRRVSCIVSQLHGPIAHRVGGDGGMVKLAWHKGKLLTDSTASNLLVHLVGTLLRFGVKLWVF